MALSKMLAALRRVQNATAKHRTYHAATFAPKLVELGIRIEWDPQLGSFWAE
jgi:hypothetical protein